MNFLKQTEVLVGNVCFSCLALISSTTARGNVRKTRKKMSDSPYEKTVVIFVCTRGGLYLIGVEINFILLFIIIRQT